LRDRQIFLLEARGVELLLERASEQIVIQPASSGEARALHRPDDCHGALEVSLLDSLRAELADYPAAEIALREFENGTPIDSPIALRIEGPSLDSLHAIAARVERLLKTTPGTQYVTNPVRVARTEGG
jgi:multidrug efflux pump subunit AcrB